MIKKHTGILFTVLWYYFLYILFANIGILSALLVLNIFGITEISDITGEFISDVILLPILIVLFQLYKKEKREELFKKPLQWKYLLKLIPISLVARLAVVISIALLALALIVILGQDIFELIDSGIEYQWSAFDEGVGLEKLFGFLSFVIFGPINEELLNRAVILEYLRKFYSTKTAIIYSSIIFMLAHWHPGLYLSSLVLGLALAYVYVRWQNLWYAILLHMLINVQPFILEYFIQ